LQPGVAGRPGSVTLRVANRTAAAFSGPATAELFLSADATLDDGDALLAAAAGARKLKLRPGATRPLPVKFTYPALPADGGDRYLLARAAGSDVAASAVPLRVVNPAIDLSGAAPGGAGATPIARGGRASASVNVLNAGTDPATGPLAVALFAVREGDDPAGPRTVLATLTQSARINPSRARRLRLKFAVPPILAPGRYALVLVVDAANAFAEPDETNNASPSPVALTVT
jgi:hypothetical protein